MQASSRRRESTDPLAIRSSSPHFQHFVDSSTHALEASPKLHVRLQAIVTERSDLDTPQRIRCLLTVVFEDTSGVNEVEEKSFR